MRIQTFLAAAMAAVVIAWWGTAQAGGDGGTGPNADFSGAWRMVGPASNRFSLTFAPAPGSPARQAGGQ